jgi:hypothetical protein
MRTLGILVIFIGLVLPIEGQTDENVREYFDEGLFFLNRGEYAEAAYYFHKLVETDPLNAHYNFKLGESYMNINGSEARAIPCFEIAVKRTVPKTRYRDRDIYEEEAPLHAWYYLGNVYRMQGRLEEALTAYETFVTSPFYYGNYNVNIVENEIKACSRAKIIRDSPVKYQKTCFDTVVNTEASEIHPVITQDGLRMVFVRRLKFYDAIFYTEKHESGWSQPVNLNPFIGSDGEFYPVSFSADGQSMFLVKQGLGHSDLYVCQFQNGSWSKAASLGGAVNTSADETWACLSNDNKVLWFASSRKRGFGGLDIYFASRRASGEWGRVKNAGKIINTPFDDDCPGLTAQGQVLYFSSKGHYSMGGYDIFFTVRQGKRWTDPVNLGFPVNNTQDNKGFVPTGDGNSGCYSQMSGMGDGQEDVCVVTLQSIKPVP